MKTLRQIFLMSGLIACMGTPVLFAPPQADKAQGQNFQISEDELKAMNLDPKEAEELRQFFDALNNLTPAQKQELEEIGRATAERMRKQGLDPDDLDDLMKFMESEGLADQQSPKVQKPPVKEEKPMPAPRPQPAPLARPPMKAEKPDIIAVTSPTDTLSMIKELSQHIASLRQKAITMPAMVTKLDTLENEIAQLSFYLNVLRSPDLIKLLTSKDFVRLHGTLERLHTSFKTFEPSISAKKRSTVVNPDDPYEVLELPYNATDDDIKARYTLLAGQRSPEALKKQLKEEGYDEKAQKPMLKAAQRTFDLIQNSYNALTKNRAQVDESLRATFAKESRKEASSMRAFENLFAALTAAISREQLLQQTHQLLEKHKPEELAQMKAQVELEKKVYERSKKRITVPQARPSQKPQASPYEGFYKKMGQQRPPAPFKPGRDMGGAPRKDKPHAPKEKGGPGGAGPAKDGKKPEAGKKEAPKSDGGKKPDAKKAEGKKDAAPSGELSKEDIGRLAALESLGGLFDGAKKQKEIEVTFKPRSPGAEPVVSKQKLPQIMDRLEAELTSGAVDNQEAAKHLYEYFAKINLEGIEKALKKAAPGAGKKLSGQVGKLWADNVAKNKELVEGWYSSVAKPLDIIERHNAHLPKIPEGKAKHHGIHLANIDPWYKPKEGEETPAREIGKDAVDLGKLRSSLNAIHTYIKETA